jgi:hypothetical protein
MKAKRFHHQLFSHLKTSGADAAMNLKSEKT